MWDSILTPAGVCDLAGLTLIAVVDVHANNLSVIQLSLKVSHSIKY